MTKVTAPVKSSLAKIDTSRFKIDTSGFTFPKFGRKTTPPIVEIRAAEDKAKAKKAADTLAWKRKKAIRAKKRKDAAKKVFVPKDFDPSDLDVDGQIPSYGILPSLNPDGRTAINDLDEDSMLPADIVNLPKVPSLPVKNRIPDLSTVPDYLKPAAPVVKTD